MNACPLCGKEGLKAIYMGLPVNLCEDEQCSAVWGFCSWLLQYVPFNGWFFTYEGPYLFGFWAWLRNNDNAEA